MESRSAWGVGLATIARHDQVLDTWFPNPRLGRIDVDRPVETGLSAAIRADSKRHIHTKIVRIGIVLDAPPESTSDAYLRLHLLSRRLVQPNQINLTGITDILPTVAWTQFGPMLPEDFEYTRMHLRSTTQAHVSVTSIDKFPRMTEYVVPEGVRIASATRVRLGAHLAQGTSILHEGFVNFNAGTLGPAVIEGHICSGVVVGEGTQVDNGALVLNPARRGSDAPLRVGKNCVIGANAGVGISLGDNCVVEAGLYLTDSTSIHVVGPDPRVQKAHAFTDKPGWLFRRNPGSGVIEAVKQAPTRVSPLRPYVRT